MRDIVIKAFEAGRKLTQDNFEEEDWHDLEELLFKLGFDFDGL